VPFRPGRHRRRPGRRPFTPAPCAPTTVRPAAERSRRTGRSPRTAMRTRQARGPSRARRKTARGRGWTGRTRTVTPASPGPDRRGTRRRPAGSRRSPTPTAFRDRAPCVWPNRASRVAAPRLGPLHLVHSDSPGSVARRNGAARLQACDQALRDWASARSGDDNGEACGTVVCASGLRKVDARRPCRGRAVLWCVTHGRRLTRVACVSVPASLIAHLIRRCLPLSLPVTVASRRGGLVGQPDRAVRRRLEGRLRLVRASSTGRGRGSRDDDKN
jgi:hypothetical protein